MRLIGAIAVIGVGTLLGGCKGNRANEIGELPPASVYNDPLHRSVLRERAIALLEESARSERADVRANALEALLQVPARAKPLIERGLEDENLGVRTVALLCAGRLRLTSSEARFRELLSDRSPYVQCAAIFALARCGKPVDRTPLATALMSDPKISVRSHAASILGELEDRSSIQMLQQASVQREPFASVSELSLLRLQIAEALVKLGETDQIETLNAALFPARADAVEGAVLAATMLGELKASSSADLLKNVAAQEQRGPGGSIEPAMPPEFRLAAAVSLAQMGDESGLFVAEQFREHPSELIRAQAAHAYGHLGGDRALTGLESLVGDQSEIVRVSAAAGLVRALAATGR